MSGGIYSDDGVYILVHEHGVIIRRSREEAEAELRRQQRARQPVDAWSPWRVPNTEPWRVRA